MPLFAIVVLATVSISVLAFVLSRIMMRRQRTVTPPGVYNDETRIDEEGHSIPDALQVDTSFEGQWVPPERDRPGRTRTPTRGPYPAGPAT